MFLADDDLAGSQFCTGTPTSHPRDRTTTIQLSLFASFLGFQAQHAQSGCNEALVSALRETQYDQLMEEEEAIIPLISPVELAQPTALGPNNETSAPKISLPHRRSDGVPRRVPHGLSRHSEHPGAADGRRFGTGGASPDSSTPRTVLLRHLPRDLLARGRPRLLIASVDS